MGGRLLAPNPPLPPKPPRPPRPPPLPPLDISPYILQGDALHKAVGERGGGLTCLGRDPSICCGCGNERCKSRN